MFRGSATPISGGAPAYPENFGIYMRAHIMRNNNQVLHGAQTRCEETFLQMLTRELFALDNLLATNHSQCVLLPSS